MAIAAFAALAFLAGRAYGRRRTHFGPVLVVVGIAYVGFGTLASIARSSHRAPALRRGPSAGAAPEGAGARE